MTLRIPREQVRRDIESIKSYTDLANYSSCASAITVGAAKVLEYFNWSFTSDLLAKVGCSSLVGSSLLGRAAALLVTTRDVPNHAVIHKTLRTVIKIVPSLFIAIVCSNPNDFCLQAIGIATVITIDSYMRILDHYARNPVLTWTY